MPDFSDKAEKAIGALSSFWKRNKGKFEDVANDIKKSLKFKKSVKKSKKSAKKSKKSAKKSSKKSKKSAKKSKKSAKKSH